MSIIQGRWQGGHRMSCCATQGSAGANFVWTALAHGLKASTRAVQGTRQIKNISSLCGAMHASEQAGHDSARHTNGGDGEGTKMNTGLGDGAGLGDRAGLSDTTGLGEGDAVTGLGAGAGLALADTTGLGDGAPTPLDPGGSGGEGGCGGLKFCALAAAAQASRRHRASPVHPWAVMDPGRLVDYRIATGTRPRPAGEPWRWGRAREQH